MVSRVSSLTASATAFISLVSGDALVKPHTFRVTTSPVSVEEVSEVSVVELVPEVSLPAPLAEDSEVLLSPPQADIVADTIRAASKAAAARFHVFATFIMLLSNSSWRLCK